MLKWIAGKVVLLRRLSDLGDHTPGLLLMGKEVLSMYGRSPGREGLQLQLTAAISHQEITSVTKAFT